MMARLFSALGLRHTASAVAPQPAAQPPAEPPPQAGEPPPPDSSEMREIGRRSLNAALALGETLHTQASHSPWGRQVADEIHQKCDAWIHTAVELRRAGEAAFSAGDTQTAQHKLAELENLITEISEFIPQTDALATTAAARLSQHQLAGESVAHLSRQLERLRHDTETPLSNEHNELALAIQGVLQTHPHGAPLKSWQRELMRRHWDAALFCSGHIKQEVVFARERIYSERNSLWRGTDQNDPFLRAVHDTEHPDYDDLSDWSH